MQEKADILLHILMAIVYLAMAIKYIPDAIKKVMELMGFFKGNSSPKKGDTSTESETHKYHIPLSFLFFIIRIALVLFLTNYIFSKFITADVLDLIVKYKTPIGKSILMTIAVSFFSILLGTLLGCLMAFLISNKSQLNILKSITTTLIYILLSIPALVLILLFFYSGISNSTFIVAVFALSINLSPFVAKIISGSIRNIPKDQIDAAKVFGFPKWKILRKFTVSFVVRHSLQPLLVEYYTTIKLSSLAGYIGLVEAFHTSQEIIKLEQDPINAYIILTLCYIVLVAPIAIFADTLENWYRNKKTQL